MDKEKKLFQIVHAYEDIRGDSYYGIDFKETSYTVYDTEQKVSIAVKLLNKANRSCCYGSEPEDERDFYYDNQNYYYYKEVKPEISLIGLLNKLNVPKKLAFNREKRRKKT